MEEEGEARAAMEEPDGGPVSAHPYPFGEDQQVCHSKDFFARMESRVSLQSLGGYIRDGGTKLRLYQEPFQERLDNAFQTLEAGVLAVVKDRNIAEKIQTAVNEYGITVIDVYFSLGAKAGARLNALLMGGFDKDY